MDGDTTKPQRRVLTFQRGPFVLRFIALKGDGLEQPRINAVLVDPADQAVFVAFTWAPIEKSRSIRGSCTQRDAIWIGATSFDVSRDEGIQFDAWLKAAVAP